MAEILSWAQLPKNEKQTILTNVAEDKGILENAVEKDFWVTMVLKAVFSQPYSDALCFKGGTSLSKGWNLIERFSEDIDLAIDRRFFGFAEHLGKSQRTKLRKTSKLFVEQTLVDDVAKSLEWYGLKDKFRINVPETSESDKDPVEFFVDYDSVLGTRNDYVQERVKLEISCRSMFEPVRPVMMRSMIDEAYPDEKFSNAQFPVSTVVPERTFLEKIFLLHEEFNRPGGCTHLSRLTRHMYDIEKLMDTDFAHRALSDKALYDDIIEHRREFTAWSGLDYSLHQPATISFLPPEHIIDELSSDYAKMQTGFIYGDSINFGELLTRLQQLQDKIRNI